jgi:hypothetical protein
LDIIIFILFQKNRRERIIFPSKEDMIERTMLSFLFTLIMCLVARRNLSTYVTLREGSFKKFFTMITEVVTTSLAYATTSWENSVQQISHL